MELRHLRYFVAVAEAENVTRAAARLHVSQPAVTRQVQELEDELGVPLFTRTAKSIHLNEAGRRWLRESRAVLARLGAAAGALRAAAEARAARLNLAYAPTPTTGLLTPILRDFRKRLPGVKLGLFDVSTCEMLEGLRARRFDVGLTVLNSRRPPSGLAFDCLREDDVMLGVAPDHPLARRRSVTVKDLLALPFVVLNAREYPDYHEMLRLALGPAARRLRVPIDCDSGASFLATIESGRAVGIASAAMKHAAHGRIRLIPLTPRAVTLYVGALYRRDRLSEAGERLVEIARSHSQLAR